MGIGPEKPAGGGTETFHTRERFLGRYGDAPVLVIGTHFAGPSAGRIVRDGDSYRLDVD